MNVEIVGWLSSGILVLTIGRQVLKQWREGARGVSKWLFVGQVAASTGFVVYSIGTENAVFIVTNSLLLMSAILGLYSWWRSNRPSAAPGRRGSGINERAASARSA